MTILRITLLIAALGTVGAGGAQLPQPSFAITINTPKNVIEVGSELKLDITTKNVSNHTGYRVESTGPGRSLKVDVLGSDGIHVLETPRGQKLHGTDPISHFGGGVFSARIPLKSGETFEENLILSEEYDLSRSGNYTIQVYRSNMLTEDALKSRSSTATVVKSNIITITISRNTEIH